jgi:hypothetical protein
MKTATLGRWLAPAALAFFEYGCGHTEVRAVSFDPPGRPADVTVFTSQAPAGGQDLGTVSARGGEKGKDNDVRALYQELVRQTRAKGGNALVIESIKGGVKNETVVPLGEGAPGSCEPDCPPESAVPIDDAMSVELKGKAMRLSPDELKGPAQRKAP